MGLGRNYCCCGPSDSVLINPGIKGRPLSCLSFALTAFCPQRCRIQPWHAVASSRGLPGTLDQGASASADSRSFMRQLAMRKHWLLLTCSCVATAMAPPRSLRRSTPRSATTKIRGASARNAERPDGTTRLARRRFIGAATASEDLDSRIWILNYARSPRPQARLSSASADGADRRRQPA